MQIESRVKELVDKYKKKIEEHSKKDPNTIVYGQSRLNGYIDGLLEGIKIALESTEETVKVYNDFIKKYLRI